MLFVFKTKIDLVICKTLFYKFIYLLMAVLGLRCCAGLSLVAASGGYSLLRCVGFSLQWILLLRSMGSRRKGFSSCGTWALDHRLSSCGAWT